MLAAIAILFTLLCIVSIVVITVVFWQEWKKVKDAQNQRLDQLEKQAKVNEQTDATNTKLFKTVADLSAGFSNSFSTNEFQIGKSKMSYSNAQLSIADGSLLVGSSNLTVPTGVDAMFGGKLNVSGIFEATEGVRIGSNFMFTRSKAPVVGFTDADADMLQLVGKGLALDVLSVGTRAIFQGGTFSNSNPENLPTQFPSLIDGKNRIRGETIVEGGFSVEGGVASFASNIDVKGGIFMSSKSPGSILEYGFDGAKYGMTTVADSSMRVYAPGGIVLGTQFHDDVNVNKDEVRVNTEKFCLQDQCVTREMFKTIIQNTNKPPIVFSEADYS